MIDFHSISLPPAQFGRKKDSQAFVRDGYKVVGPLTPHKIKERVKELVFEVSATFTASV